MRHPIVINLLWVVCFFCMASSVAAQSSASQETSGVYFKQDSRRIHGSAVDQRASLGTPQACVAFFLDAGRQKDWSKAAYALNFRLHQKVTSKQASETARKLYYLLEHNAWVDWAQLPDRPDGVMEGSVFTSSHPLAGKARKSIVVDKVPLGDRDIEIRIERVKVGETEPVWLFAAHTVNHVDALYAEHGPSWLAESLPEVLRERSWLQVPVWQWLAMLTVALLGLLVGWLVGSKLFPTIAAHSPPRGSKLVRAIRWPVALLVATLVAYSSVRGLLTLPAPVAKVASPILYVAFVVFATWLAIRVLTFFVHDVVQQAAVAGKDPQAVDENGTIAQLTVARYVLIVITVVIGLSVLMISMDMLRSLGIALLSSAGAVAVVFGIAGHAVLGNLISGLQIALTHPFRIGDTVYVEDNWGRIEELRYTYVVVRTWDERRVIFPIKYFINHWFDNWSKTDAFLIKPIYLQVDYRAEVQTIREKFLEFVKADGQWAKDRDEPEVLVTELGEETITIRLTCGGATPSDAWQLSCRMREKMIGWLQQYESGAFLPRHRLRLEGEGGEKIASGEG